MIQSNLEGFTRQKMRSKQLGEALTKLKVLHFNKRMGGSNPVYVWALRERLMFERNNNNSHV